MSHPGCGRWTALGTVHKLIPVFARKLARGAQSAAGMGRIAMKLFRATAFAVSIAAASVGAAWAQSPTKMTVGYTATMDTVPMFAAIEKGIFAKRGLEVTPQLVAVNSLLPAALIANNIQLGMTTTTTFLQAVDGGIDLVSVSGLNFTRKNEGNFGVLARSGSGIAKAQDFAGKKVGVPGLNAFLHVLFVDWLKKAGVDARQVAMVETPFPQMNEILKSGSVEAVVAAEPFQSRIIKAGTGTMVANFVQIEGLPIVVFAGARDWVGKNAQAAKAYREGMAEGMAWVMANQDEAREIAARNLKLPLEIVKSVEMPAFGVEVTPASLQTWIGIMKEQNMLTRELDVSKLRS
jgi:NitT/TauT family transport system substrate-binding protein